MHRLTARLLFLFALVGNILPLAQAAAAAPVPACCRRTSAHHCHTAPASESDQLAFSATGSCSHDCCRALTSSQWAHAQPAASSDFAQAINARIADNPLNSPKLQAPASLSTRAPPAC